MGCEGFRSGADLAGCPPKRPSAEADLGRRTRSIKAQESQHRSARSRCAVQDLERQLRQHPPHRHPSVQPAAHERATVGLGMSGVAVWATETWAPAQGHRATRVLQCHGDAAPPGKLQPLSHPATRPSRPLRRLLRFSATRPLVASRTKGTVSRRGHRQHTQWVLRTHAGAVGGFGRAGRDGIHRAALAHANRCVVRPAGHSAPHLAKLQVPLRELL